MERLVKERLVGAAVLMAAAIILVPEMLSGPEPRNQTDSSTKATAQRGDAPIKTYTIDLNQTPGGKTAVPDERAPPPEVHSVPPSPAQQPVPETQAKPAASELRSAPSSSAASVPVAAQPAPAKPVVEPPTAPAQPPPRAESAPGSRPLASAPSAPKSGAWAVQLGSFAKEATAERLVKQLRAQGQDAFVMPVKSGAATLYRVRIGPLQDRASAEAVLREVKTNIPGAAVVAHP